MTKPVPGIKIQYLQEEQYPEVEGLRCVQVKIPDDDAYMAVLAGLISQASKWFNYARKDKTKARAIAELWRNAYKETDWDNCMNCEELIECIQPLLDAQTIQITNNILNQQQFGTQNPGQPMSGGQSAANIAEGQNPTCDLDILWAQCLSLVQFTNRQIVDVLEKVEAATNVIELAGLVGEIPLLGWLAQLGGSELVSEAINYFQEAVLEEYQAQYTEDVENDIACELFCLARGDCAISVDDVWSVFESRLSSLIPTTPGDLIDLIEIFSGLDFDGTEVVDVCFYFAWGAAKLAQFIFGENLAAGALSLITALAVDDASGDWELLCTTCTACYAWDFSETEGDWDIITGDYGPFYEGDVNVYASVPLLATNVLKVRYEFASPVNIGNIRLDSSHADMYVSIETSAGDVVINEYHPAPGGSTIEVMNWGTSLVAVEWMDVTFLRDVPDGIQFLNYAQISYSGPTPTGGEVC